MCDHREINLGRLTLIGRNKTPDINGYLDEVYLRHVFGPPDIDGYLDEVYLWHVFDSLLVLVFKQ